MKQTITIMLLLVSGCTFVKPGERAMRAKDTNSGVTDVLNRQVARWNAGDIEGFMAYYWNDERLTFSSGGTTTRGWQAALERYQRRYPTVAEMGKLDFADIEVRSLAADVVCVLGQWHVRATAGDKSGRFTLILRRIKGEWLIVHDHTSSS